jgi:hypothetical protein
MSIFKFDEQDIIKNTIRTRPHSSFFIYDGTVQHNHVFPSSSLPTYSFITKAGTRESFKTISTSEFNNDFIFGDTLTGSSITFFSSSLERTKFDSLTRDKIKSLRTTYDYYKNISPDYAYSSSLGNKATQTVNLIEIPSIFYGTRIQKKTVELKFFVTGTLVGHLHDQNGDGNLIQIAPQGSVGSGSVAGVVLYREGFISLTGSWELTEEDFNFNNGGGNVGGQWIHFGGGIEADFGSGVIPSASFSLEFSGTQKTQNITMFCHASEGELNYSNNPTFIEFGQKDISSSYSNKYQYKQKEDMLVKNITQNGYLDPTGSFEKITYITKINLYDEDMNIIGVAKLAKPIKKKEERGYTFKIGLDI